jgi:hypothetical protein
MLECSWFIYIYILLKGLVVQSWSLCWAKTIKVKGAKGEFPHRLLAHQILMCIKEKHVQMWRESSGVGFLCAN